VPILWLGDAAVLRPLPAALMYGASSVEVNLIARTIGHYRTAGVS
jgi:hypothetical protein